MTRPRTPGRGSRRRARALLCSLAWAPVCVVANVEAAKGRDESRPVITWSAPTNLSKSPTSSRRPAIAADARGGLHVFWIENLGGEPIERGQPGQPANSVLYVHRQAAAWSEPVDVVHVSGRQSIENPQVAIDGQGRLHLLWRQDRSLHHAWAPIVEAGSARGWSSPELVAGELEPIMLTAGLAIDEQSVLHVVYQTRGETPGVWYRSSSDDAATWSPPRPLFLRRGSEETSLSHARIVLAPGGAVHVTWATNTREGFGHSLYHAWAAPPYDRWSEPWRIVARGDELHGPRWPYLAVAPDGILHLIHTPGGIVGRTYRSSADGGRTWSEPQAILTGLHGINGYVFPLWDGAGRMHLIVNMRTAGDAVVGIYHAHRTASGWSDPRPADTTSAAAPTAHHTVGVVTGDEIHLVYAQNDVGEVWHLAGHVAGEAAVVQEPAPAAAGATSGTGRR